MARAGAEPTETARVLDAIRRIVQTLRIASRDSEVRFGMSAAQLFVLHRLAAGEASSLNELAARTLTHQSSVSVVVQRLVDAGLVERTRSSRDGRQVVLSLTAKGRVLARRVPRAAQDRLIDAIEALAPEEQRMLGDLLARVAAASDAKQPPPMFFEETHKTTRRRRADGSR